jgi:shikimate dehydrogenase
MIEGTTRLTGLLGWPVKHSKSPRLHNEWLRRAAIDAVYLPLAVEPHHLACVLAALPRMGFVGVNVTVPHKQSILPMLDRLDPTASSIGAVNTVVFRQNGASLGLNTDAFGFLENLTQADPDFRADAGPAVLLGAGGAARAAAAALLGAGARELRLVNRSPASAQALADALGGQVTVLAWQERARALEGAALLVNATCLGMQGQPPLDLALDALPQQALVNDLVYVPLTTPLLTAARRRGNRVADGLGMLLQQARPAFHSWWRIWPEITPDIRRQMES